VVAIVLFGSGKFFKKTETYLSFFEGSVKGLNVGSPVVFRGVQVGQVTEIIVGFDATALEFYIPVIFEIDPEKFKDIGPRRTRNTKEMYEALVARGLRTQLQMQSLVTGQLMINIDFHPNTSARLIGIDKFADKIALKSSWEIPTVPTPLQRLEKSLEDISFKEIVEDIKRAMDGISNLATSQDLTDSISELKQALIAIKELARNVDSRVEPLATGIDQTLVEARSGIGDARKLIINIDKRTAPLMSRIQKATDSAKNALEQADTTLKSIEDLAEEGTKLRYEVSAALREVGAAARSVRVLSDFIEQHPDALLRGRTIQTGGQ
jgi:paraquat-inducible protein B